MTTVSIHQPNFLPWLGYFDKIMKSDVFIILDDVQIPKKGASWSNRVQILIGGRPQWVTVPILRGSGKQQLNETVISDQGWESRILATLLMAYSRASHYEETKELLDKIFSYKTNSLCSWNIHSINQIFGHLQLSVPKIVLSSNLAVTTKATERLRDLIIKVDGSSYLCGGGSDEYLEKQVFFDSNIKLQFQKYEHQSYPQLNTSTFNPGLSVIDALMMVGIKGTRKLIGNQLA